MGELIFFGACNGRFYALDKASARLVWKYDITKDGKQRSFHVNPVADQGVIYVGCDHGQYFQRANGIGHLYAFDLKTGAVKWKYKVDLGVGSDPVFDDKNIYIITVDDQLLSLQKETGQLQWSFRRAGQARHRFPKAAPLLHGQLLYLASADGHFYALDKKSGRVMWKTDLDAGAYASPTMVNGSIYVITQNKTLYHLDRSSGARKGSLSLPSGPSLSPLFDSGSLFIQSARALYAVDAGQLALRWTAELGSYAAGRFPVLWRDCVIGATQDGRIRCLRRDSGSPEWEYRVDAEITGGIGQSGDVIYVGTRVGGVHAIRLK